MYLACVYSSETTARVPATPGRILFLVRNIHLCTSLNAKKVKEMLEKDNSTAANSQRLVARRLGCSHFAINRILKKLKLRPLKHATTTHNADSKMAKRA